MWFKKALRYIYGSGGSGGNIGVVPERCRGTAPAPKPHPKIFGEELHEIATPIHEENEEKLKKLREIREDQYKHYAEIVFGNTKEQMLREANNGCFRYSVLYKDIENMLKDNGVGGLDIYDLYKALNKLGQAKGIKVETRSYTKDLIYEDGEREECEIWVIFRW